MPLVHVEVWPFLTSPRQIIESYGVSETVASLGLALYVLGCEYPASSNNMVADFTASDGLGPLLFSPLSEVSYIGRNPIYIITFAIFILLTVAAALAPSFPGFLVIRFLQGFFGSPCLATGAATLTDMVSMTVLKSSTKV